uniref:DUF4220 domain-containing protein n=1 Tax=Oryza brachyantha TaxID=4533 RepID=J3N3H3_ORYBR
MAGAGGDAKLLFVVVVMAVMGSTLYINGFMQLFFPWRPKIGSFHLFLRRFSPTAVVRFVLNFAFFQFVPLVSATFSFSQSAGGGEQKSDSELLLMLLWLLLVDLILKKVQGLLLPTDGSSFSRGTGRFTLMDYAYDLSHLVWVGYLIYTNLPQLASLIVIFVALWSLCLAKLLLSVVNRRLASVSWHTARNPLLIAGYMQKLMEKQQTSASSDADADAATLSTCKFVVMGEHRLVAHYEEGRDNRNNLKDKLEPATISIHGYGYGVGRRIPPPPRAGAGAGVAVPYYCDQSEQKHLHLLTDPDEYERPGDEDPREKGRLVTVQHVLSMHKGHPALFYGRRRQLLEDLCLSFSLFKMLRRRFEHYPMVEVGSDMARAMMLDGLLNLETQPPEGKFQKLCNKLMVTCGLCRSGDDGEAQTTLVHRRPFQVLQLELELLANYYQQAAAPVVMSQPILFIVNFVSSFVFLALLIGAVLYVIFIVKPRESILLYCRMMHAAGANGRVNYVSSSLSITVLLVLTVVAIETHEFWTVHVFSNWNIVRMVCIYYRANHRRCWLRSLYFLVISIRFFTFSLSKSEMTIYQVSIFDTCGPVDRGKY